MSGQILIGLKLDRMLQVEPQKLVEPVRAILVAVRVGDVDLPAEFCQLPRLCHGYGRADPHRLRGLAVLGYWPVSIPSGLKLKTALAYFDFGRLRHWLTQP